MLKTLYASLVSTAVITLICCGIYPFVVTGLGQLLFHSQVDGSLIQNADGKVIGSALIGQAFTKPEYFHGRPSAAGNGYDAANSSGSNFGPTNQKLADGIKANVDAYLKENPTVKMGQVPPDAVTASGSGLDPHIAPENARAQIERVAKARGASISEVQQLVESRIEAPLLGFLGEPVLNVLLVNLELDQRFPMKLQK